VAGNGAFAGVVIIAVDPHKRLNAVEAVDEGGAVLAQQVFEHSTAGFKELTSFARTWRRRQWAVEGANGVGKNLAQRLVSTGEVVWDVPSKKSSLVRAFSATSGRKTDEVDAHAVALAALSTPGLEQVRTDDHTAALRLLASRRHELVGSRVQAVNRLHRELQILIPGGAQRHLTATKAKTLLASVRPRDEVGKIRKALVVDQLADLVRIDIRLLDINRQIRAAVKAAPTTLPTVRGVGPVITAIVLGEVRDVARFADADHFASYNGSAPTTWGSAGDARPCVNRGGNRRLNHALHMAAVTQLRHRGPGREYYLRKRAAGKKPKEALRCLKRRVSDAIYRQLVHDAQASQRDPGGHMGATTKISAANPTPTVDSSIKPQPGSQPDATPAAAKAS
jgi:transposase